MQKLKGKYGDEEVLVCRTSQASKVEDMFIPARPDLYKNLARQSSYIKRCEAEYNPLYLQLVSYVIASNLTGDLFFVSRRKAGDERLVGKWSFFGGHINPCDLGLDTVMNAAVRELNEEVDCEVYGKLKFRGTVRDDNGPTSEHIGMVFQAYVGKAAIKETTALEGQWMTKAELFQHYNDFEAWAQYIIDALYAEMTEKKEA